MFTSIDISDAIAVTDLEPSLSTESLRLMETSDATDADADAAVRSGWRVERVPDGFMLIASRAKLAPGAPGPMEQLVYSDGLASVSLFIEMKMAADENAEGLSSMGAANAYTTIINGYLVTAVGDVPVQTVEMMAMSAAQR